MATRGVRGATVVARDDPNDILRETKDLLAAMLEANPNLQSEDIGSVIFTVTHDLNSCYPAGAAREMGWRDVPLLCTREIPVPGSLQRCIRVLIHWNTDLPQKMVQHVYLKEAAALRPEWKTQR